MRARVRPRVDCACFCFLQYKVKIASLQNEVNQKSDMVVQASNHSNQLEVQVQEVNSKLITVDKEKEETRKTLIESEEWGKSMGDIRDTKKKPMKEQVRELKKENFGLMQMLNAEDIPLEGRTLIHEENGDYAWGLKNVNSSSENLVIGEVEPSNSSVTYHEIESQQTDRQENCLIHLYQINLLRKEIEERKNQLSDERKKNEILNDQIKIFKEEIEEKKWSIVQYSAELGHLKNHCTYLRQQIDEQRHLGEEMLDAMKESLIYQRKITVPPQPQDAIPTSTMMELLHSLRGNDRNEQLHELIELISQLVVNQGKQSNKRLQQVKEFGASIEVRRRSIR